MLNKDEKYENHSIFLTIFGSLNNIDVNIDKQLLEHSGKEDKSKNFELVTIDSCKWLVDDAKWFYTPHAAFGPQDELVKIEVIGDTLIGDRVCSILGVFRQNEFLEGSEITVFYEKENEKVYLVKEEEFKLLFDFSSSFILGDTISYYIPENLEYYDISSTSGEFITTGEPLKHRNAGHEWVVLPTGEQLRIVNTELVDYSEENCFVMSNVIDGIGSVKGLMGEGCLQLTIGVDGFFRCFQSNTLNYTAVGGDCLITSVDEIAESEIKIYPNPTTGQLNIETERRFSEIKIFDVTGKLLLDQRFSDQIDLGGFVPGLYLLELRDEDSIYRKKIVKE